MRLCQVLRMMIGRRWKRWIRFSLLVLSIFIIWFFIGDLLPAENHIDSSDTNPRREYDHWGPDETDLNWLPGLVARRLQEIPVVVVEEHYEVLKYWFQAADLGVIPTSKNVLIHIDAHVDGSIPYDTDMIPVFRYPRSREEIHNMMQRNDMFIVTAVLTGLIDHVVWVYPDWDSVNLNWTRKDHFVVDVKVGYMQIKIPDEMGRHNLDLCACWNFRQTQNGTRKGLEDSWECHRRNFTEIEAVDGPEISKSDCQVHSTAVLEVVSETAAETVLRKIKPRSHNAGLILDIDEDFFGCWSDMIALEEAGIQRKDVNFISDFVSELLCGTTASEEQLADEFYSSLIYLVLNLKSRSCDVRYPNLEESKNCLSNVDVINFLIENIPSILQFPNFMNCENILCKKDPKLLGYFLQALLLSLQSFSVKQLKLLAKLGVCFTVSPPSRYFHDEGQFHVCHGENMPNKTLVTFHQPADFEIMTQTTNLHKILRSSFQGPNLVTVCRSVRDGYTPKQFFSSIEPNVLQSITDTYRGVHFENIHFDTNLLGGKLGWPHRFQDWNHKLLKYLSIQDFPDF